MDGARRTSSLPRHDARQLPQLHAHPRPQRREWICLSRLLDGSAGASSALGDDTGLTWVRSQVNYIVKMIAPMVKHGVTSFECKLDAEMRYNREIQARLSA